VTIGAIQHVAVVVRSIDEALPRYERLFGWRPERAPFDFPQQGVRLCFLPTGDGAAPRLELVEPVDPAGGVARFLAERGEGVHHVCLVSDDLPADLAALAAAEAELIDSQPRTGAHGRVAFIHPRTLNGVLWELVEQIEDDEGEANPAGTD
jgi:methylmalonyl-CoA/ethylmalonyl-CoA epimerase